MLRVKNLRAYYETDRGPVKAVDNVSFEIESNQIVGIAGESGCGKSTLIKVLYDNVEKPLGVVDGSVEMQFGDQALNPHVLRTGEIDQVWWRDISYVPQSSMNVLNPVMRIEHQFFDAIPDQQKKDKKKIRMQIVIHLNEVGLPGDVLGFFPHQLSGGMRQRVIIALATFMHPRLVLADEPTTALDVVVQKDILAMLVRLQQKMQNTVVIVSHDIAVHYQITKRLLIMYAGKLVEYGPTDSVFTELKHPYTNLLIRSLPRIGDGSSRQGISGSPPSLFNPPEGCRFAPRCPLAMDKCQRVEPVLRNVGAEHYVACHLHE